MYKGYVIGGISFILVLFSIQFLSAATIPAISCNQTHVQAAITAASDGDTVTVPLGQCTWSSGISTTKGITIQGAGATATVITGGGFDMNVPAGKSWRITGFGWTGTTGIGVYGTSKSWRIDHNAWSNMMGRVDDRNIWIEPDCDYTSGVIDHNSFYNVMPNPGASQAVVIHVRSNCARGNADWIRSMPPGSATYHVFIEDNVFNDSTWSGDVINDCEGGGSMVVRFNKIQNQYVQTHDAEVVGIRGCRAMEVYENNFTVVNNCFVPIALRGGREIVFNNTLSGAAASACSEFVAYVTYRTYQTGGDPWNICGVNSGSFCAGVQASPKSCTSDAQCGGEAGSCIKKDGNATTPSGYPCRDQLGTEGNNPQVVVPSLFWNNKQNGVHRSPGLQTSSANGAYNLINRDYCDSTLYPTTCNGTAVTYRPYTYPHPLVTPLAPDTIAPTLILLTVANITSTNATISWGTDEATNGTLEYGLTASLGTVRPDANLVTTHRFTLASLTPNTLYYYRVRSSDASSNTNVSATLTFFTRNITHPADTNLDATMAAAEFTLYNQAYKLNLGWSGSVQSPSSTYYSRALLLFKTAPTYRYDSTKTCPLCWVSS